MSERDQHPTPAEAASELRNDVDEAAHELDEKVRRLGDETLADYERRRERLIRDIAGPLPEDTPEPQ
jgi:hypothetical protein